MMKNRLASVGFGLLIMVAMFNLVTNLPYFDDYLNEMAYIFILFFASLVFFLYGR